MIITELQLLTDDLDSTRNFYNEKMGLEIIFSDTQVTRFSAGRSVLTFHQSDHLRPVYHFAFNIPGDGFESALEWAAARFNLLKIASSGTVADFRNWNARAFYFYDNNNNIVEIIARFDLDNRIKLPFSGAGISSISEIGTVVADSKAHAKHLLDHYDLKFFSKQPPMDDFIAVGDDEGLFIIVPENRNWYPTLTPSSKHFVKISIEVPGDEKEITLNP